MAAWLVSDEGFLSGLQMAAFSLHAHVAFPQCVLAEKEKKLSEVFSLKVTNPIRPGPHDCMASSYPNYFPKTVSPSVWSSTYKFWGIQSIHNTSSLEKEK